MSNQAKFAAIRKQYLAAAERLAKFENEMRRKYGQSKPPAAWMTRVEERRLEGIHAAQDRASDKMFKLLDAISPRGWRSGVAWWWVMEKLTYEDAVAPGALSVVPVAGYGTTLRQIEQFAQVAA